MRRAKPQPVTHLLAHYDLAMRRTTITFLPCRHQHSFTNLDEADAQYSSRAAKEFVEIHRICWDCVFLKEIDDA